MKKEKTLPKLKKEAWAVFSQYIRLRDCLKTTDTLHMGACYTCGKVYPYTQLQAGHFLPGRRNSVLFNEEQVHAQCMACNVWNHGDFPTYLEKMRVDFGSEKVEEMIRQRHDTLKFTRDDLIKLKVYYQQKVLEIANLR